MDNISMTGNVTSSQPIRIGIIETDVLYPDLVGDYESYGVMFRRLFAQQPSTSEWQYEHFYILDNHWPDDIRCCDAYLLTGSKTGVYDQTDWMSPLTDWVRAAYQAGIPLIGVCFGHQFLAHALGGFASKSDKGWGVGVRSTPVHALPSYLFSSHLTDRQKDNSQSLTKPSIDLIYSHQDQVQRLPDNAHLLLGDEFCPFAAFEIPSKVMAFQGHPEFDKEYCQRLLPRRADAIGIDTLERGLASLDQTTDHMLVADWMIKFIYHATRK